jgi:hypothetical protein
MRNLKIYKRFLAFFSNEEVLQLFLKFSEGELSDDEKKKIDKWVYVNEERRLMFENLKKKIKFQKMLSIANEGNVKNILKDLQEAFPGEYDDIPDGLGSYILLRMLRTNVDYRNWEMCSKIAKSNRWIRVFAFGVRAIFIVLIMLITYATLFHK